MYVLYAAGRRSEEKRIVVGAFRNETSAMTTFFTRTLRSFPSARRFTAYNQTITTRGKSVKVLARSGVGKPAVKSRHGVSRDLYYYILLLFEIITRNLDFYKKNFDIDFVPQM